MNLKTISSLIVLLLIVVGAFFLFKNSDRGDLGDAKLKEITSWIEVTSGPAFEQGADGENKRELKTGDSLSSGMIIATGPTGAANIYISDGSTIRLDSGSTITLDSVSFNRENGTLVVRVFLSAGRIWSKIISLATPESEWEVKTSNAVATVRGTAFGTEYRDGRSRFVGSENTVAVKPIDPKTNAVMERSVLLTGKSYVDIKTDEMEQIKRDPEYLVPKPVTEAIKNEVWVSNNELRDSIINRDLEKVRSDIKDESTAREEFGAQVFEKFKAQIEERQEAVNTEPEIIESKTETDKKENTTPASSEEKIITPTATDSTNVGTVTASVPVKLEVLAPPQTTKPIVEKDRVQFKAVLHFKDGTSKDVTGSVQWNAKGGGGRFGASGLFETVIDSAFSEIGEVNESVSAVFKSDETGTDLQSDTVNFKVVPFIEATVEQG
jgi:hypothetical protein